MTVSNFSRDADFIGYLVRTLIGNFIDRFTFRMIQHK